VDVWRYHRRRCQGVWSGTLEAYTYPVS
jgi:hypothetical protein